MAPAVGDPEAVGVDRAEVRHVDPDGFAVRYLVAGEGPPVLLVHGGMDSAAVSWRETIPALAAEHTAYAPDLPGYGGSGGPEETPTPAYYVGVLVRFLDALDMEPADVAGISLGGAVGPCRDAGPGRRGADPPPLWPLGAPGASRARERAPPGVPGAK